MTQETKTPQQLSAVYNPYLCAERMGRLKSDIDNGLTSIRNDVVACKQSLTEKMEAAGLLAATKNEGYQRAVLDALTRIEKSNEDFNERLEALEGEMPTDNINRLAGLEGWRKYILGMAAVIGIAGGIFWKYLQHIIDEHQMVTQKFIQITEQFIKTIQ